MSDPLTNGAKASILWEGGTMSVFKGFGEGVIKVFPNIIDFLFLLNSFGDF